MGAGVNRGGKLTTELKAKPLILTEMFSVTRQGSVFDTTDYSNSDGKK